MRRRYVDAVAGAHARASTARASATPTSRPHSTPSCAASARRRPSNACWRELLHRQTAPRRSGADDRSASARRRGGGAGRLERRHRRPRSTTRRSPGSGLQALLRSQRVGRPAGAAAERDPSQPLFNRAVQATYVPGSTFKTVTAAAAIDKRPGRSRPAFRLHAAVLVGTYSVDCRNSQHVPRLDLRAGVRLVLESHFWTERAAAWRRRHRPINPWLDDTAARAHTRSQHDRAP